MKAILKTDFWANTNKFDLLFIADASWSTLASAIIWYNNYSGQVMQFQTYSHIWANSTNTSDIAKTQWIAPETGTISFNFVGTALLSLLSDSQRTSFLFIHEHTITIIRVEAINENRREMQTSRNQKAAEFQG